MKDVHNAVSGGSFYKEQQLVNVRLRNLFDSVLRQDFSQISIDGTILSLTEERAVSEKYIRKRINFLLSQYPDLVIEGDTIRRKI